MIVGIVLFFGLARQNLVDNLEQRNIATGFGFLANEASFIVSETVIDYEPSDTYGRVFLVGMMNTIKVAVLGSISAILLGTFVGILLLSKNWLLRNICYSYVNLVRNTPLILQLLFWYMLLTEFLPSIYDSVSFLGTVFFTNRGFYISSIVIHSSYYWSLGTMFLGFGFAYFFNRYANRHHDRTGRELPAFTINFTIIIILTLIPWAIAGFPLNISVPVFVTPDFLGGSNISPEFLAIYLGLTLYTATFIAEVVRAGIVAIPKGQVEAGSSIGLTPMKLLKLVILPQAIRIIIPPLTNQILNLFKNSTLAVAIGYPDFVSIANTTLNQTGQAIEAITAIMIFYLSVSLLVSLFMNWFNHKMRLVER
ncbi:MAG: ABC transporter permease subunit [SAR324 cluster bacterium]|nr:ABC transporter permease subunit [SAR324 cluster bacterium]